jgi:hypothetical protein
MWGEEVRAIIRIDILIPMSENWSRKGTSTHVDVFTRLSAIRPSPMQAVFRLSVLMVFYIHPLYVLVSKILSSIFNSPAPIHPLYHPLSTLSTVEPTCHFI